MLVSKQQGISYEQANIRGYEDQCMVAFVSNRFVFEGCFIDVCFQAI